MKPHHLILFATVMCFSMQTLASEFSQVYKEFVTSTDALQKWRYAPKFADGQAVATKKMKVQMDFKVRKSAQR